MHVNSQMLTHRPCTSSLGTFNLEILTRGVQKTAVRTVSGRARLGREHNSFVQTFRWSEPDADTPSLQFQYRAGNTAHGEAWKMQIVRARSGEYRCTIEDIDPVPPHATFYGSPPPRPPFPEAAITR